MEIENEKIYSKFQDLIAESCAFDEVPSQNFQHFHHDFLKFSFGVMELQIDYQKKSIQLWSPKPFDNDPLTSYNIDASVIGTVSYVDFEATLLGCIEKGRFQLRFYKHLIHEYVQPVSKKDNDNEIKSV